MIKKKKLLPTPITIRLVKSTTTKEVHGLKFIFLLWQLSKQLANKE